MNEEPIDKTREMFLARQSPAFLQQVRIQTRGGIKGGLTYSMLDERAAGGQLLEQSVMVCNHCGVNVIINPDRTRPREHCNKCFAYICDSCKKELLFTEVCTNLAKARELLMEQVIKGAPEIIQPFNRRKSPEDLALRESKHVY